nr:MAG TPA_asm: hypothetical protein [Bacteriophage sp.]DAM66500.1 MAG TPA: hypothetical protein [Caudoviricetes sp.]DAQ11106.1 MAG TPA: hypothetical protein [Caudoviricetes sp.]DAQ62664.1 MAG TPA: hypothetical protein [Caudoviricetes sp.]
MKYQRQAIPHSQEVYLPPCLMLSRPLRRK